MLDQKAYQQKLNAQLKEWKAGIDLLTAKAQKATAQARIEMTGQVDALSKQYEDLNAKVNGISAKGEDALESTREAINTAAEEFRKAFERTLKRTKGADSGALVR